MTRARMIVALLVLSLLVSGCAEARLREFRVTGNTRVLVTEDGKRLGQGNPVTGKLDVTDPHTLEVSAEGHTSKTVQLQTHTDGGSVGMCVILCILLPIFVVAIPFWIANKRCTEFNEVIVTLEQEASQKPGTAPTQPTATTSTPSAPAPSPPQPAPPPTQPAPEKPKGHFCGSCGVKLEADTRFCPGCGAKR